MLNKEQPKQGVPAISRSKNILPKSPTSVVINIAALAITVAVYLSIRQIVELTDIQVAIICFFVLIGAFAFLEFIFIKPYKNLSTGLDFSLKQKVNLKRSGIKLVGLYSTLLIFAAFYWLFHVYRDGSFGDYWTFLKIIVPLVLITSIPYFIIIDRYMRQPQDGYWHMGMLVLTRWAKIDREELKQHFLGWLVKAFFLPLMFTSLVGKAGYLRWYSLTDSTFYSYYDIIIQIFFAFDLLFVTVGYAMSIRLLDSHIRSTEPTLLGWIVALICYQPFWNFTAGNYLEYSTGPQWDYWLKDYPVIYVLWGSTIIFLIAVYVYATMPFGLRFSNLTNRGILSNGPYRFCKHPAYVSKNLSWWLISIPFIVSDAGVLDSVKRCILLMSLNFIYFMRARTEERHLSRDPVYVEYATKMNQRSIFARLGGIFPVIQYKPHKLFNV